VSCGGAQDDSHAAASGCDEVSREKDEASSRGRLLAYRDEPGDGGGGALHINAGSSPVGDGWPHEEAVSPLRKG